MQTSYGAPRRTQSDKLNAVLPRLDPYGSWGTKLANLYGELHRGKSPHDVWLEATQLIIAARAMLEDGHEGAEHLIEAAEVVIDEARAQIG
jgi:hypothetical protein